MSDAPARPMDSTAPKVSVIIPCLNGARYVADAIRSLRRQTFRDFEVVLVDNGSTDNSAALAREAFAKDGRFRVTKEPCVGIARALNRGLEETSGSIVMFLDVDDFYYPDRIARLVECHEKTGADLVACNGRQVNETGEVYAEFDRYTSSPEMVGPMLFQYNLIWTMSFVSVSRSALGTSQYFPDQYDRIPDHHIILDFVSRRLKVHFLDEFLVGKRYHGDNLAFNSEIIERQSFDRLIRFKNSESWISDFYTEDDFLRMFTERYARAAQYFRRKGLWHKIPGYLEEYAAAGYINRHVFFYFNALALMNTDYAACERFVAENRSRHPLWYFASGLLHNRLNRHQEACADFEAAYVRSLLRFPEALMSLALASYHLDLTRSERLIRQVLRHWPEYLDAAPNRRAILKRRPELFKHTAALMPKTLQYLSTIPM